MVDNSPHPLPFTTMYNRNLAYALLLFFYPFALNGYGQDSTIHKLVSFPDKLFSSIENKTAAVEGKLNEKNTKYLAKLQRQESKLKKKLLPKDSILAQQLFQEVESIYTSLQVVPQNVSKYSSVYSGHLDSLTTALNFLKNNDAASSLVNNPQVEKTLQRLQGLQGRLNQSDQIQKYLQQRQQLLKEAFQKLGMAKELRRYQKQAYYYSEQVRACKEIFEDPGKLEARLLEVVMQLPQFRDFFAKHSQLGGLFALPGASGSSTASLQGLQTRAMLNEQLAQRFGPGADVTQMLQQNLQAAQASLSALRNKVGQYSRGAYGNTEGEIEQSDFKPKNHQKTKSFFKRLEVGGNIQTQKARSYFPITSDIAATLGYQINDNSVAGIGISGKVGLGSGWNDIRFSQQGLAFRSFLDWRIKGGFYASGGFEMNQWTQMRTIEQFKNYPLWQKAGLLGLTKKYTISKKLKGNAQLLWDYLSYQQRPRMQNAVLIRVGYNLK